MTQHNNKEKNTMTTTKKLENFMAPNQLAVLNELLKGEEKEHFEEIVAELSETFETMPKSYEQDGKGDEAVAYLHYFKGGYDFYITEKDMCEEQHQAFGLVSGHVVELGYVSIIELQQNGVELDFYFTPTTIGELKKKHS